MRTGIRSPKTVSLRLAAMGGLACALGLIGLAGCGEDAKGPPAEQGWVTLTQPRHNQTFKVGETMTVEWKALDPDVGDNFLVFDILIDGARFPIGQPHPAEGRYEWVVPDSVSYGIEENAVTKSAITDNAQLSVKVYNLDDFNHQIGPIRIMPR